jgi:hypothetical protein
MIFEELIKQNRATFIAKVISVAAFLGVQPEWLKFCTFGYAIKWDLQD